MHPGTRSSDGFSTDPRDFTSRDTVPRLLRVLAVPWVIAGVAVGAYLSARLLVTAGVPSATAYGVMYPWYFTLWLAAGATGIGVSLRFIHRMTRNRNPYYARHARLASALSAVNAVAVCGLIASEYTGVWDGLRHGGILGSGCTILFLVPYLVGCLSIAQSVSGLRDGSIGFPDPKGGYSAREVTVHRRNDPVAFWIAVVGGIVFGLLMFGFGVMLASSMGHAFDPSARDDTGPTPPDPRILSLPADGEVAEVRASLRRSPGGLGGVPEFVVPPGHVPAVLGWLRPPRYEPGAPISPEHDELGEVVIRTRAGQEVRLRLYRAARYPVFVTRDGVNYFSGRAVDAEGVRGDGGVGLSDAIRAAHGSANQ